MPHGLDHVAHAVRDLDAGAALYRRLGFTVGARNRHPWGTHNHIVQLPGFFIEILTVAEPDKLAGDGMSVLFGEFHRRFLGMHEGLSFLVLESANADADAAHFSASGIAQSGTVHFRREGQRPDGTPVTVAFSLAFAQAADADAAFATCQQHFPENFWNRDFQIHPNGVTAIGGVALVADDPPAHAAFLQAYCGHAEIARGQDRVAARTVRGQIEVMTPELFVREFGCEPSGPVGTFRLAALRFLTGTLSDMQQRLKDGGFSPLAHAGRLVVPPAAAHGATVAFEAAA
ncbi:VOC family protein [Pseudorhodoplanes sp.]|uniref:VOC family protein n=1 Tax=Pseudorhodoplanes sp. TaxID=1934341 RepID=UPI003D14905D